MGRDFTLFAKIDGIVRYDRLDKERKRVNVRLPSWAAQFVIEKAPFGAFFLAGERQ